MKLNEYPDISFKQISCQNDLQPFSFPNLYKLVKILLFFFVVTDRTNNCKEVLSSYDLTKIDR